MEHTYTISTVGSVLSLCLVELHLLLLQNRLHFRVFGAYDLEQVLRESFCTLHLLFIRTAVGRASDVCDTITAHSTYVT